jgi:hypothetical protein
MPRVQNISSSELPNIYLGQDIKPISELYGHLSYAIALLMSPT